MAADAASYFVRENMTGFGLFVDAQTSLTLDQDAFCGHAFVSAALARLTKCITKEESCVTNC